MKFCGFTVYFTGQARVFDFRVSEIKCSTTAQGLFPREGFNEGHSISEEKQK